MTCFLLHCEHIKLILISLSCSFDFVLVKMQQTASPFDRLCPLLEEFQQNVHRPEESDKISRALLAVSYVLNDLLREHYEALETFLQKQTAVQVRQHLYDQLTQFPSLSPGSRPTSFPNTQRVKQGRKSSVVKKPRTSVRHPKSLVQIPQTPTAPLPPSSVISWVPQPNENAENLEDDTSSLLTRAVPMVPGECSSFL